MTAKESTIQKSAAQGVAEKNSNPLIRNEKFRQLYTTMLKCRMLAERMSALSGRYGIAAGKEALAVGITLDLRSEDTLVLLGQDLIPAFIKGVSLNTIFRQSHTDAENSEKSRPSAEPDDYTSWNILPTASSIAEHLHLTMGIALANKTRKNGNIVVIFAADDSTSLPSWHEALHIAGTHDLPVIFVVQNDLEVKPEQVKQQTKATVYSFPNIPVDGSDVVAVYRVAQESIAHARQEGGPTLITCKKDSRSGQDPIANMESYLAGRGLFDAEWKEQVVREFIKELSVAAEMTGGSSKE